MASSQNVELEAAKFLHKLIQDSKDEPAKLATKLCVILQHMKSSGKEHSMPYQVISRAMETVINQHNLDIESLKSSRPPSSGAGSSQRGTSQAVGVATDSRAGLPENVMPKMDSFASGRPPFAPSIGAPDHYQGSAAQRSGQSFDHGSPSSLDSRSANSQSRDRRDTTNLDKQVNQKDGRKATSKRKRGDTLSPAEPHVDIPSHLDQRNTANTRKGKMTKAESSDGLPVRSGELTNFNRVPSSSQMQRANQEGPTKIGNPVPCAPNSKYPEDTEVSSAHIASGKLQGAHPMVHGGMGVATSAYPMTESVLSSSMRHGGMLGHYSGSSTTSADEPKIGLTDRHSSNSEMSMLRQGVPPRDMARSTISGSSGVPFKEQQLKQLRAQCLVFLAFRNGLAPKQLHLEIALGTAFSREGKDHTDHKGKSQSSVELGTSSGVMMPFGGLNNMRQPDNNNSSGSPSAGKSLEATSFSKGTESAIMTGDKGILSEERKHLLAVKKVELEKQIQERAGAQASSATSFQQQDSSSTKGDVDSGNLQVGLSNRPSSVIGLNKQMNPEINGFTGFASSDEASEGPSQVSSLQHELPIERRDNVVNQFQNMVNSGGSRNHHSINHLTYALKEHWKPVPGTGIDPQGASLMKDADLLAKNVSSDGFKTVPVNDASRHDATFSTDIEGNGRLPPPKYTMSGRWIMDQQKKRLLVQQNWVQKQQKTKQIMTTCFLKLKENVSSSEDISAKTKSVIELKKLQLLDLQRRLRSDFLNDFFKPITTEMLHCRFTTILTAINNLEELWALLNFLLPNIFNSSEDFSQWFNKPFESAGDNSPDEALLSEEENLLIINRLHQVLRPFVLRRLKHKVENELPEKIERLVRCEASAYQKLLMKRVEENLGSIGTTKGRSVHNSVMELRNICNHPYLSQLHAEEVDNFIPRHYLPPIIRLCGKLEMLDRILPKLKAADHRVLFFSTMTRLLDVMEEYLTLKQHRYLRLDGHTSGGDRGALIDMFNQPGSPYFIFLLSIRAGGVGVNLQAADTVIIFDTDWNPQVDLQAQARAHRIGQKKDVLVLRFETVQTVEEQVRASAEHKLGVANQSITAGFFDNNTSAEDRREYLESLLRECKKEEASPVLDDDALNDLLARSEAEIDVFEAVDQKRREDEMATWKKLVSGPATDGSEPIPSLPSRLVTDEDLKQLYEAMKISDVSKDEVASNGIKRKSGTPGSLDTQHYGRGKRAREVRSYEEQWTEEEFDKMCQAESPGSPKVMEEVTESNCKPNASSSAATASVTETAVVPPVAPATSSLGSLPVHKVKDITPPAKRGRGRPRRKTSDKSPVTEVPLVTSGTVEVDMQVKKGTLLGQVVSSAPESIAHSSEVSGVSGPAHQSDTGVSPNLTTPPNSQAEGTTVSVPIQTRGQGRKSQGGGEATRRRGKKQVLVSPPVPGVSIGPDLKMNEQLEHKPLNPSAGEAMSQGDTVSSSATVQHSCTEPGSVTLSSGGNNKSGVGIALSSQQPLPLSSVTPVPQTVPTYPSVPIQNNGQHQKPQNGSGAPRSRGKKKAMLLPNPNVSGSQNLHLTSNQQSSSGNVLHDKATELKTLQDSLVQESHSVVQDHALHSIGDKDLKSTEVSGDIANKALVESTTEDNTKRSPGLEIEKVLNSDMHDSASNNLSKTAVLENSRNKSFCGSTQPVTEVTRDQQLEAKTHHSDEASKADTSPVHSTKESKECSNQAIEPMAAQAVPNASDNVYPSISASESIQPCPPESMSVKRQGRKTQNRVEPPRRRGRKSSSASPVVSDSLANQDPNLNNDFQKSSVGKVATDVAQAQAFQILLPTGGAAHDLNTKEGAANSSLNKQHKVAPARVDSAPVSSDKISNFGRMQNVNDVARVMKEVFSGTCLPKLKAADSAAGELAKTNTTVDSMNTQLNADKAGYDITNTEAACLTPGIAVNIQEKQSEGEFNNKKLEDKASSDIPTTVAVDVSNNMCLQDKAGSNISTTGAGDVSNIQCKEDKADLEHDKQSEETSNMQSEVKAHIQHCTETYSNQSEVKAHDATPLSSAVRTESLSESCTKSSPLASSGENMSDQPQVIPSCPVVNDSQNALELVIEQNALSPLETEAPNVALSGKYSDALKHAELHENPLVKSCSQSLSEGEMNMGDSICEQPVSAVDKSSNIDPVPEENVISPAAIGDTNVGSSEVCPMDIDTSVSNQVTIVQDNEVVAKSSPQNVDTFSADEVAKIIDQSPDEPVDRSVLQQTSGSKAVANSSVDASQSVLVEEGTISETAILPSSSFSIEDNKFSSKTCAISNSETLEESMEEGATDHSEFLPPEKCAEESCRNATEVPCTVPLLLQESIDSEGYHGDHCKSQDGGIPENHKTGILAAPKTFEGGNEVETFSDKGPQGSSEAQVESKGLVDMENQAEAIQNRAAEMDVPCTSVSGDKAEGESKELADMENQANAIRNRAAEMDVPCTSTLGDKAEGESKELADMENQAEAIQNCAAEMDVPCVSAPGDKAEGESKGLADMENQAETIESCAAEMEVSCSCASGDKAEGENVLVGTKQQIQVSEDTEAVAADETDVSNGVPAVPKTASANGAPLPCSSLTVGEPMVEHDTKGAETGVANQDNQAIRQNALKDAEECSSSAAADIIEESLPQKDVIESEGVPPPCKSVAEGEHVESLSVEALVDSSVKLGTKESEASQDNLVLQENALNEMEETLPSATEDRVAVCSPEKDNLTACSEAPQESEKCENVQGSV
ncbi:chromatin structure-remodeling complex protein SYD-like [Arachis ipaensis]|uniref:chromatin structure-remodeling complex protein SYD-like n=1 Tax=Arachis ipaensis TaxID=130454 RepID=UPI000A2B46AC|nr:chromatin structure-remodeling complex protein SYD-like [Arachis ipaensis]